MAWHAAACCPIKEQGEGSGCLLSDQLPSANCLVNSHLQVAWAPGTEWEVAAGMLDIFHKLPGQAKKFLETNGEPCSFFLFVARWFCESCSAHGWLLRGGRGRAARRRLFLGVR